MLCHVLQENGKNASPVPEGISGKKETQWWKLLEKWEAEAKAVPSSDWKSQQKQAGEHP